MKIAMMGSGGVGGYFGGRLAASGVDVHFIARGEHLAAMQGDGLAIESELGNTLITPAQATDDPSAIGPVDYVIIGVKLWDTKAAGHAIAPLLGPETVVVSLQNGIECDYVLGAIIGHERLFGGVANIAASIARPGVINHLGTMQRIYIGEYGGENSWRLTMLYQALKAAGIDSETSDDIECTIWQKFVFLVGLSATTTTLRTTIGPIRENEGHRTLLRELMEETVAVGRARKVALPTNFVEDRLAFVEGLPVAMTSSMHHDLERGNRLEVDWLSGAVVRLGAELGIATPRNRVILDALKPLTK